MYAYSLNNNNRVTVILADDLAEAFDKARPVIAMQLHAESVELHLLGPVFDPKHPQFSGSDNG